MSDRRSRSPSSVKAIVEPLLELRGRCGAPAPGGVPDVSPCDGTVATLATGARIRTARGEATAPSPESSMCGSANGGPAAADDGGRFRPVNRLPPPA
eukprot:ctg_6954.g466